MGQPVIVENQGGEGGAIDIVAKAAPDGHTLAAGYTRDRDGVSGEVL